MTVPEGSKTHSTGCVGGDEVGEGSKLRSEKKADPIPFPEKGKPPLQIATKFSVDADRVSTIAKT